MPSSRHWSPSREILQNDSELEGQLQLSEAQIEMMESTAQLRGLFLKRRRATKGAVHWRALSHLCRAHTSLPARRLVAVNLAASSGWPARLPMWSISLSPPRTASAAVCSPLPPSLDDLNGRPIQRTDKVGACLDGFRRWRAETRNFLCWLA